MINKRMLFFNPNEMYKLDPLEEVLFLLYSNKVNLKTLYHELPEDVKKKINKNEDVKDVFMDIVNKMETNHLKENKFIDDNSDIDILIQPRYLITEKLHYHDFFEIVYILEGECEHIIGDIRGSLKKGDICFLAPNISHTTNIKSHDSIVVNLIVRNSTINSTFRSLLGNNDVISMFFAENHYGTRENRFLLCETKSDPKLDEIVYKMIDEVKERDKFSNRSLKVLLEQFFIILLREYEEDFVFSSDSSNCSHEIIEILRYIEKNHTDISLSSVASKFNYSEAHLSRLIKKHTKRTFSEIHRSVRVNEAADLLMDPRKSIQEISEIVGYTDTSHFYRTFKRFYNCTPAQYRKIQLKHSL